MSAAVKNFVFADESKFFELADGPDTDTGLPTVLLPVGAELYRADHAGAKEPGAEVPAFFTNRGSTAAYKRGKTGALSSYVVKKEARLFHMTLNSVFSLMPLLEDDKDVEVLMNYLNPEELVVNPSGFTRRNLIAYRSGANKHPNYLNRRMADIICRLGFDGWIVKPFDRAQRTGLEQMSYYMDGATVKTRIVLYTPEIMLCKWKDIMDLKSLAANGAATGSAAAGTAGGRRRRTRRRTHRK